MVFKSHGDFAWRTFYSMPVSYDWLQQCHEDNIYSRHCRIGKITMKEKPQ
jgi:hypothetical protein